MHVWRKRVRPESVDDWTARLSAVVDSERLVVVEPPQAQRHRLEAYLETAAEAAALVPTFGGQVSEVLPASWQPAPATAAGRPLVIGTRLLVTSREEELAGLRARNPGRQVLCIPAAMAFGTGEHATTSMCLRLLLEVAQRRAGSPWKLLDIGTGSGILALAGKAFGADGILGLDNDPHAVRTARENATLNDLAGKRLRFAEADLLRWRKPAAETWPVVTANLFSGLLVQLLPETIAPALAPAGDLILSGVLATQEAEVLAAIASANLECLTVKRRGKWRAFHCRKSDPVPPRCTTI